MGIQNYYQWLKKTYPTCFIPMHQKNVYDYIYFDMNHLLHHGIYSCSTEKEFFNSVGLQLDMVFNNFLPRKHIVLAVDGPSPYAKILLQRKRRLMGIEHVNMNKLNSLHLSPGTEIMRKLDDYLLSYMNKYKNIYNATFTILSTTLPDEGEIKLIRELHKNEIDSSHLIIGNDADLIVLAMSAVDFNNINILIKQDQSYELVNIDKLIELFSKKFTFDFDIKSLRTDFSLISLMLGNDYLPKLPSTNMDNIWNTYIKASNAKNNHIMLDSSTYNLPFLRYYLLRLSDELLPQYKKIKMLTDVVTLSRNYLEGLLWCMNMYHTGVCSMYDYCYTLDIAPTPVEILFFLEQNQNNIMLPTSDTPAISCDIYTLFIMPKQAKSLIANKYHNVMNTYLKHIYDVENCAICAQFKISVSNKNKLLKIQRENVKDDDSEQVALSKKTEINNTILQTQQEMKKYKQHKNTHTVEFNSEDIRKILQITN